MVNLYKVGGCVRDELLGLRSKDIDFAVEASSFEEMENFIKAEGGRIFLSKPEFFTIRAKLAGIDADFVLCRRESGYSDGRRPDKVEVGTIDDDLARRDFTVNAIAVPVRLCHMGIVPSACYHDPFNGIADLKSRTLRCVGNPADRFTEDSLRLLRAIRFAITKDFAVDKSVSDCLWNPDIVKLLVNVSQERIREELHKCFKHNTLRTLNMLQYYPIVRDMVFNDNSLWLKPTTEA